MTTTPEVRTSPTATSTDAARAATSARPVDPGTAAGAARVLLAATGTLFALFPLLRPWPDESHATPALAGAMASDRWMVAHLCGVTALIAWPWTLAAVRRVIHGGRTLAWAVAAAGAGAGLVLPYFGAEIFAIHELAGQAETSWDPTFLDTISDIRFQPVAGSMFVAGLLLLGTSGVLLAVAWWRSGAPAPRWAAIPLGVGLALFGPQFFAGEPVRVVHGVALGISAWLLAALVPTGAARTPGSPARRGA